MRWDRIRQEAQLGATTAREGGNPGGAKRRSLPPRGPVIPAKAGTYWA